MAIPLTVDGVTFSYPQQGDTGYASQATSWAQAITNAVAALELKPYAECTTTAGQSITSGATTIVNFGTVVKDTASAVTTGASWKFTAPTAGQYIVSASIAFSGTSMAAATTSFVLFVYKNGAILGIGTTITLTQLVSQGQGLLLSTIADLAASDYIDVRVFQNNGGARTLTTTATDNRITIKKVE